MSDLSVLPPAVRTYVRGYWARGRRLALLSGFGFAAAGLCAWVLACCTADRLLQLGPIIRSILLALGAILVGLTLWRTLRRRLGPVPDWVDIAERIERLNPRFGQRLQTVTSRLLGRPEHRGSDEILEHLVYTVNREAGGESAGALLPLRPAMIPWVVFAGLLGLSAGLLLVPGYGLPRLAQRYFAPLGATPPVTTTRLRIWPGDRDVAQASPFTVEVEAERLDDGQVWLLTSDDEHHWARMPMNATGPGRYTFTFASIDRDLRYRATGGDASTPICSIRVLRRPAVAEFRIHYRFPAYTGKPPITVTNTDGVIEAPAGSEAQLTIIATEPLQSATLLPPGAEKADKILMARGETDTARECRFPILRDGRYDLDLISTRDVLGAGPTSAVIHALPDRPPVAILGLGGSALRVTSRDILPLAYEAIDDYGIDAITLKVQAGTAAPVELPIFAAAPRDAFADGGSSAASASRSVVARAGRRPSVDARPRCRPLPPPAAAAGRLFQARPCRPFAEYRRCGHRDARRPRHDGPTRLQLCRKSSCRSPCHRRGIARTTFRPSGRGTVDRDRRRQPIRRREGDRLRQPRPPPRRCVRGRRHGSTVPASRRVEIAIQ